MSVHLSVLGVLYPFKQNLRKFSWINPTWLIRILHTITISRGINDCPNNSLKFIYSYGNIQTTREVLGSFGFLNIYRAIWCTELFDTPYANAKFTGPSNTEADPVRINIPFSDINLVARWAASRDESTFLKFIIFYFSIIS